MDLLRKGCSMTVEIDSSVRSWFRICRLNISLLQRVPIEYIIDALCEIRDSEICLSYSARSACTFRRHICDYWTDTYRFCIDLLSAIASKVSPQRCVITSFWRRLRGLVGVINSFEVRTYYNTYVPERTHTYWIITCTDGLWVRIWQLLCISPHKCRRLV